MRYPPAPSTATATMRASKTFTFSFFSFMGRELGRRGRDGSEKGTVRGGGADQLQRHPSSGWGQVRPNPEDLSPVRERVGSTRSEPDQNDDPQPFGRRRRA